MSSRASSLTLVQGARPPHGLTSLSLSEGFVEGVLASKTPGMHARGGAQAYINVARITSGAPTRKAALGMKPKSGIERRMSRTIAMAVAKHLTMLSAYLRRGARLSRRARRIGECVEQWAAAVARAWALLFAAQAVI